MIVARIVRWMGVSLLLLLVLFGSVATGLAQAIPALDAGALLITAASALLLGWLLARSPFPGWMAGVLALILGVEMALLRLGNLGGPLTKLLRAMARLGLETWRWPLDGRPDGAPVLQLLAELAAKVGGLLNQWWEWMMALTGGEPTYDPLAAALVWNLVVWAAAAWAAWAIRRRQRPLLSVTPASILLASLLSYSRNDPATLLTLLASTLLLLALTRHNLRRRRWQRDGVDFPTDTGLDLAFAVIPLTLALVLAATLAPTISIPQISRYARQAFPQPVEQTERAAESLGVGRRPVRDATLPTLRAPGLPRRHLIGSGPGLSEQVVMVIKTEPQLPDLLSRAYWRSLTYDRYTGRGWFSSETETVAYQGGKPAAEAPPFPHQVIQQEVHVQENGEGLLYTAGALLTADHDYHIAWRATAGQEGDIFGATIQASSYRVESWLPTPSKAQLRTAGEEYPDWILNRYLILPSDLPTRVLTLTQELTEAAPTPYDRAEAIESYLRAFTYTLDLPAPPADRDVVDYFLFDLQQGYCDYYATAMVVMARAAGLPARLVTGYGSGTYDQDQARFIVTAADAHSWVEIYFPNYGWVEFEPTGGRPAIERPEHIPPAPLSEPGAESREKITFANALAQVARFWWLGVILPALAGITWLAADGRRLRRLPPDAAIATLYRRLCHHSQRVGALAQAGDTPYEMAALLTERLAELAQGRRWGAAVVPAAQEVEWLTRLYVSARYSAHRPDAAARSQAIQTWGRLRWRLWLAQAWQCQMPAQIRR